MPMPVPPRTPTPPPDDHAPYPVGLGFEGELSVGSLGYDPNTLSPMSATFPSMQYATLGPSDSVSQRPSPSTNYTPASATFPYTPTTVATETTDGEGPSRSGSEDPSPFNFQPVAYQPERSQAAKQNVRHMFVLPNAETNRSRISVDAEGTNTNTAVSPTRSSSNLHHAPLSSSLPRFRFQHSRSIDPQCPRTRNCGSHGVFVI